MLFSLSDTPLFQQVVMAEYGSASTAHAKDRHVFKRWSQKTGCGKWRSLDMPPESLLHKLVKTCKCLAVELQAF